MTPRRTVFKNAFVIDGLGSGPEKRDVYVEDGVITDITAVSPCEDGWECVDLSGKYLMPGLIEMHGHFYANRIGYVDDVLEPYTGLYLAGGVTTVRSCGERFADRVFDYRDAINKGEKRGPRIITAGWYLNRSLDGGVDWMPSKPDLEGIMELYESQKARVDFVKVYNMMPAEWIAKVCSTAHADGFKVCGHLTACSARDAILAGLDSAEHGPFYMSEFYNGDKRGAFARLRDFDPDSRIAEELIELIAERGTAITPTNLIIATLGAEFTKRIDDNRLFRYFGGEEARRQLKRRADGDANEAGFAEQEDYMRRSDRFINKLYRAGGRIFCGTDPVYTMLTPGYGLVWEAEYLHDRCGLSNEYIIRALTSEAAGELGIFDKTGSLEKGKLAEMAVLSKNPAEKISNLSSIECVYKDGRRYGSEEIRRSFEGWFDRPFSAEELNQ